MRTFTIILAITSMIFGSIEGKKYADKKNVAGVVWSIFWLFVAVFVLIRN